MIDHSGAKSDTGRSHEGIEIWNRDWQTYKDRLFPEDPAIFSKFNILKRHQHSKLWSNPEYWHTKAGTHYSTDNHDTEVVKSKGPILGIEDFFKPGTTTIDMGCGGGSAAIGMAKEHKETKIIAVDYEMGKAVPFPKHTSTNLTFQNEDWRHFTLADNSVDAVLSDQGIARYGSKKETVAEMTRIAKPGAIFRGTKTRGLYGTPDFDDLLAEAGWDVWHLRSVGGQPSNLLVAKLTDKK